MSGNSYGDSVRCLSDYVSEHHPDTIIVWAFTNNYIGKANCEHKKVVLSSLAYFYHLYTSKYIVTNFAMDFRSFSSKRKGQICLQTWHGTALKKIGYDMYETDKNLAYKLFGVDRIKNMGILTDYLISGSNYMTKIFKERFRYEKEIFEIGTPRNDIFFKENPEIRKKVRDFYSLNEGNGIILYAPTFRNDEQFTYYDIDLSLIKQLWEERTGHQYTIMVRLHPNIASKSAEFIRMFPEGTVDASFYPDMQELLYDADVLITDYSSSMFDFMLSKKPIIMYVPDRQTYSRGFYLDIVELPFIIVNNNSEISAKLSGFDNDKYQQGVQAFLKRLGSAENGNATEKAYRLLTEELKK
jgi:CDP-glycerol glycerophosphotransferase